MAMVGFGERHSHTGDLRWCWLVAREGGVGVGMKVLEGHAEKTIG